MMPNRFPTRLSTIRTLVLITILVSIPLIRSVSADTLETFYALEDEMAQAHEAHLKALSKLEGDKPAHRPVTLPDGRIKVLKKMDALADKTLGKKSGAAVAIGAFNWSWNLDLDLDGLLGRFKRIVDHYADEPDVEDLMSMMAVIATNIGAPDGWIDAMYKLARKTSRPRIRLATWYALGETHLKLQRASEAKAAFQQVIKLDPASNLATLAKGGIFELEHLQIGMVAPDFTTQTVDGRTISLKSLRGKVVLVDFWATWCGICVAEMPRLQAAADKLKGKPFEILGISLDHAKDAVISMLEHTRVPGIQTWDKAGIENPVGMLYNANSLPTWYLLDGEGVIRARDPEADKLPALVNSILSETKKKRNTAGS